MFFHQTQSLTQNIHQIFCCVPAHCPAASTTISVVFKIDLKNITALIILLNPATMLNSIGLNIRHLSVTEHLQSELQGLVRTLRVLYCQNHCIFPGEVLDKAKTLYLL
jgi:hypothetical protein